MKRTSLIVVILLGLMCPAQVVRHYAISYDADGNIVTRALSNSFQNQMPELASETEGISDISVKAYPNPVKDILTIELRAGDIASAKFQLFSANSQMLMEGNLDTTKTDIILDGIPAGICLLRVQVGEDTIVKKIEKI